MDRRKDVFPNLVMWIQCADRISGLLEVDQKSFSSGNGTNFYSVPVQCLILMTAFP